MTDKLGFSGLLQMKTQVDQRLSRVERLAISHMPRSSVAVSRHSDPCS